MNAWFAAGLALILAISGLAAWPLTGRIDGGHAGLLAGLGFAYASLVLGFLAIRGGLRSESPAALVRAILGGMAARVVALMTFALIVAFATRAHLGVALATIVVAHLVVGPAEIVYLKRMGAFS